MTKINVAFTVIGFAVFFAEFQQSVHVDGMILSPCSLNADCISPSETCDGILCYCSAGYVGAGNGLCYPEDCGTPVDPSNGGITTSTTTYLSTGTVTCDSGYTLNGSSPITCSSTGSWTTIPTCKANSGSTLRCMAGIYHISLTVFVISRVDLFGLLI